MQHKTGMVTMRAMIFEKAGVPWLGWTCGSANFACRGSGIWPHLNIGEPS